MKKYSAELVGSFVLVFGVAPLTFMPESAAGQAINAASAIAPQSVSLPAVGPAQSPSLPVADTRSTLGSQQMPNLTSTAKQKGWSRRTRAIIAAVAVTIVAIVMFRVFHHNSIQSNHS